MKKQILLPTFAFELGGILEHNKDYLAWIQYYYADNKSTTISAREHFYNVMTGCHTFEL